MEAEGGERLSSSTFLLLVWLAASGVALLLYGPALHGPFVGDDIGYISNNPYIRVLDLQHLLGMMNPRGGEALFTANWAPVHTLACMLEWHFFGVDPFGYHVVNVLGHGLVVALLVAFFTTSGFSRLAACCLGAIFLIHPANVEAVAWAFQLKTILALGFVLAALLAFPRRPWLAALLFALALLSKIAAAFALPVLATQLWVAPAGDPNGLRRRWPWLLLWTAIFAVCAWPEYAAFARYGTTSVLHPYADVATHLRSIIAVGARYLWMAATSLGVSAFQEPAPSGPLDPWWIAGAVVLPLLAWRMVVTLRRRDPEAVYWVWAAAAFAPVSQIFPFLYPVGDRYLYTILPGLLGGALLLGRQPLVRLGLADRAPVQGGILAGAAALVLVFTWHASFRIPLWQSPDRLVLDAAGHYPNGTSGSYVRAATAMQRGEPAQALKALHRMADLDYDAFSMLAADPTFRPLHGSREFRAIISQVAGNWIHHISNRRHLLQAELRKLAWAHQLRGEDRQAIQAYERALAVGGPYEDAVRGELAALREKSGG